MLAGLGARLDRVVELTVDVSEVIRRLNRRGEIEGRSDDTEDVIRHRQDVYVEQTAPLVDLYRERSVLVQVDGMGEVDEVTERLTSALQPAAG
jgi:adenylate kinase